jgi:hypothetical protein
LNLVELAGFKSTRTIKALSTNVNWQHTFTHLASNIKKKGYTLIVKGNYDDFTQKTVGSVEDIPNYPVVSRCVRRS